MKSVLFLILVLLTGCASSNGGGLVVGNGFMPRQEMPENNEAKPADDFQKCCDPKVKGCMTPCGR